MTYDRGSESFHGTCQYAGHPDAKIYSIHYDTNLILILSLNYVEQSSL